PPFSGRHPVKFQRVSARIAILLLVAAAFVGLTGIYADSVRYPQPGPREQAERLQRPSEPDVSEFLEFVGGVVEVGLYALMGRLIFRLRLSPRRRGEGQPIMLNLHCS